MPVRLCVCLPSPSLTWRIGTDNQIQFSLGGVPSREQRMADYSAEQRARLTRLEQERVEMARVLNAKKELWEAETHDADDVDEELAGLDSVLASEQS